jgi:hypothetical protein
MKILFFIACVFFLLCHYSYLPAQNQVMPDTLNDEFLKDSLAIMKPKLFRPQLRVDSRSSSYEKQRINLYGYDAGILFRNKLRLALGYYRINNDLPMEKIVNEINSGVTLAIHCGQFNTEIVYYNGRYFSLGFPWEFGFGQYRLTYTLPEDGAFLSSRKGFLSFTNFGLSLTFTPIPFIGLKAIAGYRKSIYPPEKTFSFNGTFSSIGFNIDMQEAARDIRMYRLKKKYNRNFNGFSTYVDLLTN